MEYTTPEERAKLASACRILYYEQATSLARGHQCLRIGEDKILLPGHLHPFGLALGDVQSEDLVVIDFQGNVLEGKHKEPMGEHYIYSSLFKQRKETTSIIHFHPPYMGALACAGQELIPISRDALQFRNQIALFEKFPLYIGDREHADAAARALGDKKVLIHRGHGAVVVGRSIEDALLTALSLEKAARTQWMVSNFGQPQLLPTEEMQRFPMTGIRNDEALKEGFLYYVERLKRTEAAGGAPVLY